MNLAKFRCLPRNALLSVIYVSQSEMDLGFILLLFQKLTDMAVALFVGLTALDTVSIGSSGGGSSNDDNWRDHKDEVEIERARRCARIAAVSLGKTPKSGRRR